jgi:hypothetical protein
VAEDVRDRPRVEARVDRVEHGAEHGDPEVGVEHRGDVWQHRGDGVARPHAARGESGGETPGPGVEITVGEAQIAVDHGDAVGVDLGRAGQEDGRRQRLEVRGRAPEVGEDVAPCGRSARSARALRSSRSLGGHVPLLGGA